MDQFIKDLNEAIGELILKHEDDLNVPENVKGYLDLIDLMAEAAILKMQEYFKQKQS